MKLTHGTLVVDVVNSAWSLPALKGQDVNLNLGARPIATIGFSVLIALNFVYFGGISLNLLTLMGGTLDVQSTPGQGSTFMMTLPIADTPT